MKKGLMGLIIAGILFSFTNNSFSQNMKEISPKKVEKTRILKSNETNKEKFDKIDILKYQDYNKMLEEVKDIEDAEIYCTKIMKHAGQDADKIMYGEEDYWASFNQSFYLRLQDCDDGAIAAASLLYDNGFHPYFLDLDGKESGHLVFLYKNEECKFGTIGINEKDCKRPKYKDIGKLVEEFNKDYENKFHSYRIIDASSIFPDAIHKEGNYKKTYQAL